MTQEDQSFIELLQWVVAQENVPLNVRKDFVAHVLKKGCLDETSKTFIESLLKKRVTQLQKSEEQAVNIDTKINQLGTAAHNPETGMKAKVLQEAETLVNGLTHHFSSSFKARENQLVETAETNAAENEQNEIANIKASIKA